MIPDQIYDPASPSLHGYPIYRYDETPVSTFLRAKLRRWFVQRLWSLYGRDRIVAVYLHREQTLEGRCENWAARQILSYLFRPIISNERHAPP